MQAFDFDNLSLRPMGLGGGAAANPFATFSKGAGFSQGAASVATEKLIKPQEKKTITHKYPKDFLLKFSPRNTRVPPELQFKGSDLLLPDDDQTRVQQQELVEKVAGDSDNWRSADAGGAGVAAAPTAARSVPSEPTAKSNPMGAAKPVHTGPGANRSGMAPNDKNMKIEKAADKGRTAWAPTLAATGTDRCVRVIKGTLNKLTPEKFERLLQQILDNIQSGAVLELAIPLVFEKAIAEPTFCAMYADLCNRLCKELPEFPPHEGDDKAITFRRSLLNTCQDEFEGMTGARAAVTPGDARAERAVKMRILGTMRLIAELYKNTLVNDGIMNICTRELLEAAAPADGPLVEDYVEAVCEMLTIAGRQMRDGKLAKQLPTFIGKLEAMAAKPNCPSRMKFLVREVQDLQRAGWVPRREAFTAKKLSEIRSEAQAELGMVEGTFDTSFLGELPGVARRIPEDEVDLFPAFRTAPEPAQRPKEEAPAANLSEEECAKKTKSMVSEYLSVGDVAEAITCLREITPKFRAASVQSVLDALLDAFQERAQGLLIKLLFEARKAGVLEESHVTPPLEETCGQMGDLAVDIPFAPAVLGAAVGALVGGGYLTLGFLADAAAKCEDCEPRRKFGAAVLKRAEADLGGGAALAKACADASFKAVPLFDFDPEFDPPDLPPTAQWLKQEALGAVPV